MKKTAIGMLLVVILCFGCGDGNVKENEEKELQTMEETPVQSEAEKSIDQLEIQGRTQEETELIHKILSEDKEEFEEFLTTDWDFPHEQEAIEILAYDFTKDGRDEIIVSKFYLNISAILTYNYVYDCNGRKLMEFVGGHPLEMQIIDDWDGEGSFLLYTMNHYSADNNADIYTEIKYEDDALTEKVVLMELDCRYGGDEGTERYYIFKDFTKEEEEKLWYGSFGVSELAEIKECFKEGEEPEAYRKLFQEREGDLHYFSMISVIVYSEEDGFHEFRNDDEAEQTKDMDAKADSGRSIVDEEQRIRLFRDDYTWYRQIYDRASELAEEHGLYQFLEMEEPWISSEGNYCAYYMTEYSDSGVYLEARSKEDYELTYQDSVYTENFAGMDYRIIDFDRQMLAELEAVILQNDVNERCRLHSMENGEAVISTASGIWYCIDMTNKTMRQTDYRGEEKADEKDWDFHGAWGESYQHVIEDWIRMPEYEKEFADTVGGTVQYDPYLKNHIGKDLIYERYALYDLDKDGTPELILLSDRNNSMNAIFSYRDGLVYCGTYHNALYTDDGKIIERGNWWGGSVMVTESWAITELQGGKVVGEESLWKEYKDYDMKDAVYIRDIDGESTEISYEEYRDVKNALLNQADFVRNIRSNELSDSCDRRLEDEIDEKNTEEEFLEQWMSKNVWEVNISDPTQEDINRIGDMENLRSLSIGCFRVGLDPDIDLRPLTNLKLLQEFAFVGPGDDDIDFSFIKDMPGLSDIYFSKCTAIKDLSLFEDRPELLTLNVSYVDDVDLNKLSGCTQLRDLQITGGNIRNAGGLSDLTHLQYIGLCETQWNEEPSSLLQELCQDSDMTELESLELRHIQVTEISPLVNLQKIQSVRLVNTEIDDIEPLRELKYLTNLEIFGNKSERVKEQAELYFGDIEYLEISEDVPYGL